MRYLDIPGFPKPIEIPDLEYTVRSRLSQSTVLWPNQAIPLLGYMAYPNGSEARAELVAILDHWSASSTVTHQRMRQMQADWLRIGDIFNLHCDLSAGGHQRRRGGASLGKAITLASTMTQNRGSSESSLWETWKRYKDVAHLVAAATMISSDARHRAKLKPFGEFGRPFDQLQPFPIAMLLPDLVLSVGVHLQEYGLSQIPHGSEQPMLDRETLWRIPSDINVTAIAPPIRKIGRDAVRILDQRRAGNRGR